MKIIANTQAEIMSLQIALLDSALAARRVADGAAACGNEKLAAEIQSHCDNLIRWLEAVNEAKVEG